MQSLIEAMSSSDLGELPDGIADIDWIRAAGMAGQQHGTAIAVWQLCELGDKRMLRPAFDRLLIECEKLGIDSDPIFCVSRVLDWLIHPACPVCEGRAFELIPGASKPTLSDQACKACDGTGKRLRTHWRDQERALFDRVSELQSHAAGAILNKLRDRPT